MKLKRILISTISTALLLTACDLLDIINISKKTETEFAISTDPSSNVLLQATNKNKDKIVLLGEKDKNGLAKSITEVLVQEHGKSNYTTFVYDKNKIQQVIADNGVVMTYDWLSSSRIALTIVEPNTGEQINTVVDLNASAASKSPDTRLEFMVERRTGDVNMDIKPLASEYAQKANIQTKAGEGGLVGDVYYTVCGQPKYGDCYVEVFDAPERSILNLVGRYEAAWTESKGHHTFTVPQQELLSAVDLGAVAAKIDEYAGYLCAAEQYGQTLTHFQTLICPAVAAATVALPVTSPAAPAILAACEGSTAALQVYCNTLGAGAEGGDSLAKAIAGKTGLREIDFSTKTLYILPCIRTLDTKKGPICGKVVTYKGLGGTVECTIDVGGTPMIDSFSLNPPAPAKKQGYTAKAVLLCVPAGSKVTMSISGTDGYTNTKNVTINTDSQSYEATMSVPGADTGVHDQCTVTLVMPDGSKKTKNASLVFGD